MGTEYILRNEVCHLPYPINSPEIIKILNYAKPVFSLKFQMKVSLEELKILISLRYSVPVSALISSFPGVLDKFAE